MKISRIMIAAPKSGSGKTLITCALLGALKKAGKNVASVKCGPDYIDPMFHRTVLGISSENLDTFFTGEEQTKELFIKAAAGHDVMVMEGVMGLFDGLGGIKKEGSAYHLAEVTKTPVILTVDVHGMGKSMIPVIKGFVSYDEKKLIKGVLLNRISAGFYETIKPEIEKETGIKVVGFFPVRKDICIESRHLGLQLPEEIKNIHEQLEMAAEQLEKTVDLKEIQKIADDAEELSSCNTGKKEAVKVSCKQTDAGAEKILAVAKDEAFCFYYAANHRMFEERGVKIKYFSPLHDKSLPEGTKGILLGGGYPEFYAEILSKNEAMKKALKEAIESGIPSLAECGGFMYLHGSLTDMDGNTWPMTGVIKGNVSYKGKLVRFGYVELAEKEPVFLPSGVSIKAHEFHYYDSTDNGERCTALKPVTGKSWECVHESKDHFWGFPHLYYPSAPEFVDSFISRM